MPVGGKFSNQVQFVLAMKEVEILKCLKYETYRNIFDKNAQDPCTENYKTCHRNEAE